MKDRYVNKPLLRILECYVLRSINQLSPIDEKKLIEMAPKLSEIYGITGTWNHIIETIMSFPENMPDLIMDHWNKNKKILVQRNVKVTSEHFAQKFVEDNFLN